VRIVHTSAEPEFPAVIARRARRTANLETLGLLAASAVVLFGLVLTTWGHWKHKFTKQSSSAALHKSSLC